MNTPEHHWFVKGTQFTQQYCPWILPDTERTRQKLKKYFSSDYIETLQFTGLSLEPRSILIFAYTCALVSLLGFLGLDLLILYYSVVQMHSLDVVTILLMLGATIAVPVVLMNLVVRYPRTYAHYSKIHSLGDIPEILSYLVMYLKLVPNLENSVKFAAMESSTSLAFDLRKMMWDMEIRMYHGIDDAITSFANMWGRWSEYFKRSLHLIRSSIQEKDEAARVLTLNRALDVSLDGTRETMNHFVNKLHQPTMVIYSIGIMIPLAMVAMLPAVGIVGIKITIVQVFLLYDVLLPLFVFIYTRNILLSRPATFSPPHIPADHPKLKVIHPRRRLLYASCIGLCISFPSLVFLLLPVLFPSGSSHPLINYIVDPAGLNKMFPVTLFVIWGVAAGVSLYCVSVYTPYKKIRDEIKQIEKEFGDALYILGKRIAEDKSPEEGFLYTAVTMKGTAIASVFHHTGYNLSTMHTSIKDALFNQEFGSLQYVYSDRVKAIMRLFVEGIQKSQRAMSISLIKIADHLKELQAVENKIKDMLFELTSTLRSTVTLFAPLIAGVTLGITQLISRLLSSMSSAVPALESVESDSVLSSVAISFSLENVRPEYFVLVIGIYIIELVVLLTRFTNGIDQGDDKAAFMYSLGRIMPVAVVVFTLTVIGSQMMFSSIVPTGN